MEKYYTYHYNVEEEKWLLPSLCTFITHTLNMMTHQRADFMTVLTDEQSQSAQATPTKSTVLLYL